MRSSAPIGFTDQVAYKQASLPNGREICKFGDLITVIGGSFVAYLTTTSTQSSKTEDRRRTVKSDEKVRLRKRPFQQASTMK